MKMLQTYLIYHHDGRLAGELSARDDREALEIAKALGITAPMVISQSKQHDIECYGIDYFAY